MISLLENSVYIGVFLSISTFWLGMYLQQKFKSPVLNPLLVSAYTCDNLPCGASLRADENSEE